MEFYPFTETQGIPYRFQIRAACSLIQAQKFPERGQVFSGLLLKASISLAARGRLSLNGSAWVQPKVKDSYTLGRPAKLATGALRRWRRGHASPRSTTWDYICIAPLKRLSLKRTNSVASKKVEWYDEKLESMALF
jgi:hypothetical protein